jgi:pyridoxamine 5'-phosphate oxidase
MLSLTDPIEVFKRWLAEAERSEPNEANAMALGTADEHGMPSVRIVLLRGVDQRGFVFYTNLRSKKGAELSINPRAALCFHWKSLNRQVRVEGLVELVSNEEADAYFAGRPRGSQIGAWASQQSEPLSARGELERRVREYETRYEGRAVPRPPHWSGYRVQAERIEFWQQGEFRLHERRAYTHDGTSWSVELLYP